MDGFNDIKRTGGVSDRGEGAGAGGGVFGRRISGRNVFREWYCRGNSFEVCLELASALYLQV